MAIGQLIHCHKVATADAVVVAEYQQPSEGHDLVQPTISLKVKGETTLGEMRGEGTHWLCLQKANTNEE